MKDRFDLEDDISKLYSYSDQLDNLVEGILEHDLSTDEIVNVLQGMRVMLNLQAQKLHDTMSQCFGLDKHRNTTI